MNYTEKLIKEYLKEDTKYSSSTCPICGSTDVEGYDNTNYNDPYKDGAGHNGSEHTNAVYYKCNKCGCRYYDWTRTISYDGTDLEDSSIDITFALNHLLSTKQGLDKNKNDTLDKVIIKFLKEAGLEDENNNFVTLWLEAWDDFNATNSYTKINDFEKLSDEYFKKYINEAKQYRVIAYDDHEGPFSGGPWSMDIHSDSIEKFCDFINEGTELLSVLIAASICAACGKDYVELEDIYKAAKEYKTDPDKFLELGTDYIQVSVK